MNMTPRHIPFERLADLAEGRLAADQRDHSLTHVSTCASCSARLDRLSQIIGLMRADTAEDAPRDVAAHALSIFPKRRAAAHTSVVRRIMAVLSFDSMELSGAAGVRSGQAAGARQILYSAGEKDLDMRITPHHGAWVIAGQVLGECAGGRIELQGAAGQATVALNDLCEFALPPVPAGSYTLRLRLADMEIEVPDLELKA